MIGLHCQWSDDYGLTVCDARNVGAIVVASPCCDYKVTAGACETHMRSLPGEARNANSCPSCGAVRRAVFSRTHCVRCGGSDPVDWTHVMAPEGHAFDPAFDPAPTTITHNGEIGLDVEIVAHHISPAGRDVTEVRVTNGDGARVTWHVQDWVFMRTA